MTAAKETPFYNDLNLSLEESWKLLQLGKKDRFSPLHTLSIGSVDRGGNPSQRIMVLREVSRARRRLRFNTDIRSSKVTEIGDGSAISVLGYHPDAKVQLRLSGVASLQSAGAEADAAWEKASLFSRRCYLADPAPGSPVGAPTSGLDSAIEGHKPTPAQVTPARTNFAVLLVDVRKIDWLYLAHSGHRRAQFIWNIETEDWDCKWVVP